ncbi:MAG: DMT family transporter [Salinivenus sp.]
MKDNHVRYWLSVGGSVAAGLMLSVIVRINATLGTQIGELEATLVVHLVGTGFALLVTAPCLGPRFWTQLGERSWPELSGGAISGAMVVVANYVVPVLGTAVAVTLFVAGDLLFSTVSDQNGWMDVARVRISRRRLLGLLLAFVGAVLVHT